MAWNCGLFFVENPRPKIQIFDFQLITKLSVASSCHFFMLIFIWIIPRRYGLLGQGENPVFRITKKPPSETGVKIMTLFVTVFLWLCISMINVRTMAKPSTFCPENGGYLRTSC